MVLGSSPGQVEMDMHDDGTPVGFSFTPLISSV